MVANSSVNGKENIQFDERCKDEKQEIKCQTSDANFPIQLEAVDDESTVEG